jgi:hypothetical protein
VRHLQHNATRGDHTPFCVFALLLHTLILLLFAFSLPTHVLDA